MILEIDKQHKDKAIENMVANLPTLRTMLHLSQADLAVLIGVSRQHLAMIENGSRKMTWSTFLSLMFVFTQNKETDTLLSIFGIYSKELRKMYSDFECSEG